MAADRKVICVPVLKIFMALLVLPKRLNWQWPIMKKKATYIQSVKTYMAEQLRKKIKGVCFQWRPGWKMFIYRIKCGLSENRKIRNDFVQS